LSIDWDLTYNFAIAMIAIVNPVEKIPLWVAASKGGSQKFQLLLAGLITLSSAVVLIVFLFFGRQLMHQLHVELASFKIGGGLILLQFGFSMLKGRAVKVSQLNYGDAENLRRAVLHRFREIFIPIGVPVIAGPGAITTVIIYGYQGDTLLMQAVLCAALLGVLALLFLILITGRFVQNITGEMFLSLLSRIFGMLLIAIAVQFMVEGLQEVFPGWTQPG
jgi:multiple antibiotic resistance protein